MFVADTECKNSFSSLMDEIKKIGEFFIKVGEGGSVPDFPLQKKIKKIIVLKYWMLPIDHFKTHLFFKIFG